MESFKIYTSAYWHPKGKEGVESEALCPVGITLYPNRHNYGYKVVRRITELAPDKSLFHCHEENEFRPLFRERLEQKWEAGEDKLLQVMAEYPSQDLVLLCFDNLNLEGKWCHRTQVAEFISEKWNMEIVDL